jgi:orotidine-5'-phosphate decarboxylase
MNKKLIVALDFNSSVLAINFLENLDPKKCLVKVGLELFISEGWKILDLISEKGFEIFLDLKLNDIPNTVANSVKKISNFNVALTTIHLNGGRDMIEAASLEKGNIKILGVSILTSLSKNDIFEITNTEFDVYFNNLISIASNTHIDGIVCSPNELDKLKNFNKLKVVPGIRNDFSDDDQKRVMSSLEAYEKGADFIVVGRPITKSEDPGKAVELFL